jgi:hypothetical protein
MHFQVSDDAMERLDQLNTLFTEFVFHFDRMDENKLILIKMNLSKWKSAGYTLMLKGNAAPTLDKFDQQITLYNAYAMIGELLLFRKEQDASVKKQEFEKAAQFRDLQKKEYEKLQALHSHLSSPIPFFSFTANQLELCQIDQYFLSAYIQEQLATD